MEEMEDEEILKFVRECKKYSFYKSIDLKIAAVKSEENNSEWINLAIRAKLLPTKEYAEEVKLLEVRNFIIIQKIMEFNHFEELIKNITKGKFKFDKININTALSPTIEKLRFEYSETDTFRSNGFGLSEIENEERKWKIRLLRSSLRVPEALKDLNEIKKLINSELESNKVPYEDISDATKEFFEEEIIDRSFRYEYPFVRILAPIYVGLKGEFKENVLNAEITCHKEIKTEEVELSYILQKKTGEMGRNPREKFDDEDIIEDKKEKWFYKLEKTIKTQDATSARIFLILKEELVNEDRVLNPYIPYNPKIIAHKLFDRDCDKLKRRLIERNEAEGDRQANYFEQAVMTLLYMCGFNTEWIDFFESEGLDIIAVLPGSQRVIAIQCTTGDIGKRITPTLNKTKELKELLKVFEIIPAIFTCIEISEINKKDVASEGIAVIDSRRIKEILRMAKEGGPPEKVFDYINRLKGDKGSLIAF